MIPRDQVNSQRWGTVIGVLSYFEFLDENNKSGISSTNPRHINGINIPGPVVVHINVPVHLIMNPRKTK
jgi:hypothetical protein